MEQFKAIDTDGNGGLSPQEVKAWASKNRPDLTATDNLFKAAFDSVDKNFSGSVEPPEFDSDLPASQKKSEAEQQQPAQQVAKGE